VHIGCTLIGALFDIGPERSPASAIDTERALRAFTIAGAFSETSGRCSVRPENLTGTRRRLADTPPQLLLRKREQR
jgi:hypothetical protein